MQKILTSLSKAEHLLKIKSDIDDGKLEIETSLSETGNYPMRAEDGTISLIVPNSSDGSFTVRHNDGHVVTEGNFKTIEKSDDETRLVLANGKAKVEIRVNDGKVKLASR